MSRVAWAVVIALACSLSMGARAADETAAATPSGAAGIPANTVNSMGLSLLEVIVNGRDTSKIGEFVERDGMVFARPQELEALGFRVPAGAAAPDGLVPLASLPGMQYRVERTSQSLLVTAPDAALLPALLGSGSATGAMIPV